MKEQVLDNRGEVCTVLILPGQHCQFHHGNRWTIDGYITLPCGDTHKADLPVFTEWFNGDDKEDSTKGR